MGEDHIRCHTTKRQASQEPDIDDAGFHAANVENPPTDNLLAAALDSVWDAHIETEDENPWLCPGHRLPGTPVAYR